MSMVRLVRYGIWPLNPLIIKLSGFPPLQSNGSCLTRPSSGKKQDWLALCGAKFQPEFRACIFTWCCPCHGRETEQTWTYKIAVKCLKIPLDPWEQISERKCAQNSPRGPSGEVTMEPRDFPSLPPSRRRYIASLQQSFMPTTKVD